MLNLSSIQAITLDLDDTLWPIWPTLARAEAALVAWLRPQAPLTAMLFENAPARLVLRNRVVAARPDLAHNMSALRLEVIRHGLAQGGEDTGLAEAGFEVFFEERMRVDLFADVLPALSRLSAKYPIVALSNGNADVARVGLAEYFHASVSAHEFGIAKPDVRIFQAAAAAANVPAKAVLHVGDDAGLDVLGALDAGMQTVWVNREGAAWPHDSQAHVTVADLGELCNLLALAD